MVSMWLLLSISPMWVMGGSLDRDRAGFSQDSEQAVQQGSADRLETLLPWDTESFSLSRLLRFNHIHEKALRSHKMKRDKQEYLMEPKHLHMDDAGRRACVSRNPLTDWVTQQRPACCLSWCEQKRPLYPSSWFEPRLLCTRRKLRGWKLGLCFPPQPPMTALGLSLEARSPKSDTLFLHWQCQDCSPREICPGASAPRAVRDAEVLPQVVP